METTENIFVARTGDSHLFFADDSLLKKRAGTCDLFMMAGNKSIDLTLKEKRSGNLLAFESIPLKSKIAGSWKQNFEDASSISKIFRNHEFIKATAGVSTPEFTLVPESLFKPGDENLYYKRNFSLNDSINIRSQYVPAFHLHLIFGVDNELEKELNHLFQDPVIFHFMQGFLSGIAMNRKLSDGKHVLLNVRDGMADVAVSENKKLLLANIFPWKTKEDILYYTLFISEQLELNPESYTLTLTGDVDDGSALHRLLGNYIRNIIFPVKPANITFDSEAISFHHYSLLYNLALCEL